MEIYITITVLSMRISAKSKSKKSAILPTTKNMKAIHLQCNNLASR